MNLRVKRGAYHVAKPSLEIDNIGDTLTISFKDEWKYIDFVQRKNHLIVELEKGYTDFIFIGGTPKLEFQSHYKNDVVFKVNK